MSQNTLGAGLYLAAMGYMLWTWTRRSGVQSPKQLNSKPDPSTVVKGSVTRKDESS